MRSSPALMLATSLLFFAGCESKPAANQVEPVASVTTDAPAASVPQTAARKSRQFTFQYKFRVKGLSATGDAEQDLVRIWVPAPSTNDQQIVKRLPEASPAPFTDTKESRYDNPLRYLQLPIPESGEISIALPYEVERHEVQLASRSGEVAALREKLRGQLLAADKLVPTDGKPLQLLKDAKLVADPLARARQLYDVVDAHVVYKKEGTGWGRGDTNWVCDNGYGNCTDFHSLFISLARSQGLPAQFEIGFSIPTDTKAGPIAGYHCWAWFFEEQRGWIPVDISEADKHPEMKDYYFGNLTADRVMFSAGRDLELQPPPAQGPVNFLVYPYIEVGGKTLPKEKLELQFSFADK